MLFLKVKEEALKDIFAKIVEHHLVPKEDLNNYRKSSLKNTFSKDKFSNN